MTVGGAGNRQLCLSSASLQHSLSKRGVSLQGVQTECTGESLFLTAGDAKGGEQAAKLLALCPPPHARCQNRWKPQALSPLCVEENAWRVGKGPVVLTVGAMGDSRFIRFPGHVTMAGQPGIPRSTRREWIHAFLGLPWTHHHGEVAREAFLTLLLGAGGREPEIYQEGIYIQAFSWVPWLPGPCRAATEGTNFCYRTVWFVAKFV